MGRNVKPEQSPIVPINGAIYRNSQLLGVIADSTGALYFPSVNNGLFAATDFPEYIALNSPSVTPGGTGINPNSLRHNGSITYTATWAPNLKAGAPYFQNYPYAYYPFIGRSNKYRFVGNTANSGVAGTPTVMQYNPTGYEQNGSYPSEGNPVYSFTSTGTPITQVTTAGYICWYDTTTSTYRVLGDTDYTNSSSTSNLLYTSSDGITWSAAAVTAPTSPNRMVYYYAGNSSYYKGQSVRAINQKVFIVESASSSTNSYALFRSTDGGATFTDVTTAVTGTATTYFNVAGHTIWGTSMTYDGTTVFVPQSGTPRYSTNDGTSFSNSTISGVTTSWNDNMVGGALGANASTFMYLYSAQVSSNNRVFVTTNGGQSFTTYNWTPVATLRTGMVQYLPCDFDTVNNRWCFLYSTISGVYAARSTDNGATWSHSLVTTSTESTFYAGSRAYLVFLDDAFYYISNNGLMYRSTDCVTWTYITNGVSMAGYGPSYASVTDYVMFSGKVIKKSDQSVNSFNPGSLTYGTQYRTFVNYISSDLVAIQYSSSAGYVKTISSANANSANYYAPYAITTPTGQQVEYWRIK